MATARRTAVVAVGGNALISDSAHRGIHDQAATAARTSRHIADLAEAGWNVVVTHGSGPQVGFILRRSELAIDEVPPVPMEYAAADLQGAIGFMFQRALNNEFRRRSIASRAVAIVTQVRVDADDPEFASPSKPIGTAMDEGRARDLAAAHGWVVKEEPGRGWRRVVASPEPQSIVDIQPIRDLVGAGYVVIACGGGGIPVVQDDRGELVGIEAVIDKDLASSLLAHELGADLLMISTEVERVAINFGRPDQQWLDRLSIAEARRYQADGQFPKGSMGPKIEAVIAYLERGGGEGVITNPPNMARALAGETGTHVSRE